MRVSFSEMFGTLRDILLRKGFSSERAELCARLFTEASCDGVYSHGLNRFPRFIRMIDLGVIDIMAEPEPVERFGVFERWDGRMGPGNLNAFMCMRRAIELSTENTLGCVALANTNHWMRGGTYGWQAVHAGVIGICWTNTMPNLPPWGGKTPRLGNNPLVIAVPRSKGHIVLDMAMSQFSYGALASYRRRGESLPVIGGFDVDGNLTRDPSAIEASLRPIPAGMWKGSGLALMLDLIAALLSGGRATHQINSDPEQEAGVSQVFLAINHSMLQTSEQADRMVDEVIAYLQSASPSPDQENIYYPGERTLLTRLENHEKGIPVEPSIWKQVCDM